MKLPKTTENITFSCPSWLAGFVDEYASECDCSRSEIVKQSLKLFLMTKQNHPINWERLYQMERRWSC